MIAGSAISPMDRHPLHLKNRSSRYVDYIEITYVITVVITPVISPHCNTNHYNKNEIDYIIDHFNIKQYEVLKNAELKCFMYSIQCSNINEYQFCWLYIGTIVGLYYKSF